MPELGLSSTYDYSTATSNRKKSILLVIGVNAKMRPAGVCVDGGATMLPTSGIPVARGDSSTLAAGMFDPNSLGPASWRGFARTL